LGEDGGFANSWASDQDELYQVVIIFDHFSIDVCNTDYLILIYTIIHTHLLRFVSLINLPGEDI
jgi:hypothetical protein